MVSSMGRKIYENPENSIKRNLSVWWKHGDESHSISELFNDLRKDLRQKFYFGDSYLCLDKSVQWDMNIKYLSQFDLF